MPGNPYNSPNSQTARNALDEPARKLPLIRSIAIAAIYLTGVASTSWVPFLQEFVHYDAWPSYDPNSWLSVFGPSMIAAAVFVGFAAYLSKRWMIAISMLLIAPVLFYQAFITRLMIYGFLAGINGDWPEVD